MNALLVPVHVLCLARLLDVPVHIDLLSCPFQTTPAQHLSMKFYTYFCVPESSTEGLHHNC